MVVWLSLYRDAYPRVSKSVLASSREHKKERNNMKELSFGEKGVFNCYRVDELPQAQEAKERGENVMLARPCTVCGDLLFGESLDPNLQVKCVYGEHNSRPGVWV